MTIASVPSRASYKKYSGWCIGAAIALCGCVAFLVVQAGASTTADAAQIVRDMQARYHGAKTLKAIFLERYTEGRLTARVESGTAYFSRPGRMRWEYEAPEKKLFLSDGKTVWFYVPSDHTVTRAPMKESNDWRTPLSLLTGKADVEKLCSKIDVDANEKAATAGNVVLRCIPRGESDKKQSGQQARESQPLNPDDAANIKEILLEVNPRDGWLASVNIRQTGGIEMEYRFGKWEENLEIPEAKFHFDAPKGVAIVEQTGGMARE
jgi:outer membrane lipoprotein carrier protein